MNTSLSTRHFQNGGDVNTTLYFWKHLSIQLMENTIVTETDSIGRNLWAFKRPQIVELQLEKVPNYCKKWLPSSKKKHPIINIRRSSALTIQNPVTKHVIISDLLEYFSI